MKWARFWQWMRRDQSQLVSVSTDKYLVCHTVFAAATTKARCSGVEIARPSTGSQIRNISAHFKASVIRNTICGHFSPETYISTR